MTDQHTPWPSVVEIEVNRHCNRQCEYCPNVLPGFSGPATFMKFSLYKRVVAMLEDISFSGRLSFHFFNEPLMRKDLEAFVSWARARLPLAHFVLYTNGDLLSDERHKSLLSAGVDLFLVTRHDWDQYPERSFQRVQMPCDFPISGRGGAISASNGPLDLACFAPTEMIIVTLTGEVVLCHEDAHRKNIMGNLAVQDLLSVWQSERFHRIRRSLERGCRFEGAEICRTCDNSLYPVPGASI